MRRAGKKGSTDNTTNNRKIMQAIELRHSHIHAADHRTIYYKITRFPFDDNNV